MTPTRVTANRMTRALDTSFVDDYLSIDLDAWTRNVVRRHFHPGLGSPYWLRRAKELLFDPLKISRYEELLSFGPFPLSVLRELDPAELVPQTVPRPLAGRIWDTGGTTGQPCRVFYTPRMLTHAREWRRWSYVSEGFEPGRVWLQATPTGPHRIGNQTEELTELYAARVYTIDMDPRWVKRMLRAGRPEEANEYTEHILEQIEQVLRTQPVDYLNTTPALMRAMVRAYPELVAKLDGARFSGTQITPAMYRDFVAALDGGVCGITYGNTLGCASGLPAENGGNLLPYMPNYPQVTMAVVARDEWRRTVAYGQAGQVRLTVLHEDLFLPNVLERDQALRYRPGAGPEAGPGARWPCDGVANVRPLQLERSTPEGIY